MGGFITRIKGCLEFLRPILPAELNGRLERKAILEQGATFIKRNLTFGGFSLSSSRVFVYVRTDDKPAIIHRPADDIEAGGSEIHAGDIKAIVGNGAKTITVTSRNGDLLLEIEAADEPQRDQWLEGLNEVLLNNFKSTSADKPAGGPKTLKERAEKELYFQKRQMEMNAKRKEAEERKAKLMKEAGGLKYVALAMAERE